MGKGRLIAGLVSTVALATAAPAAANVLPVGTWDFNEGSGTVAHDSSLHGNTGTVEPGATWTQGRFAGALSFDGNTSAVDVPDNSLLDPPTVTVSAWVQSSTDPGRDKYILAKGANSCSAASYGLYTGEGSGLEFYVSSNDGTTFVLSPDAGQGVWDGGWHSVVGTYDGSTIRLYVDGRQVGAGTPDTAGIGYGLPSNDLLIGNYAQCSGLGFAGQIDSVHVFNRVLGPDEIRLGVLASQALRPATPFDLVL